MVRHGVNAKKTLAPLTARARSAAGSGSAVSTKTSCSVLRHGVYVFDCDDSLPRRLPVLAPSDASVCLYDPRFSGHSCDIALCVPAYEYEALQQHRTRARSDGRPGTGARARNEPAAAPPMPRALQVRRCGRPSCTWTRSSVWRCSRSASTRSRCRSRSRPTSGASASGSPGQ